MSGTTEDKTANGGNGATLAVEVWRGATEGRYQRFEVPYRPNQTVLDVVTYIQRNLDPALAWTGVKDSGRGCTLSRVGYEQLTRPKSFHLRTAV